MLLKQDAPYSGKPQGVHIDLETLKTIDLELEHCVVRAKCPIIWRRAISKSTMLLELLASLIEEAPFNAGAQSRNRTGTRLCLNGF